MKYEGSLYGKIGNRTFDTGKTSADWDKMESALKSAKDCIEANRRHIESMGRHAVEGTSATLDEISNALMPNEKAHLQPPDGDGGAHNK